MTGAHCMLDFETLGNRPSTVVISLGAVLFHNGKIHAQREWFFDLDDQVKSGRTIDTSTLKWWFKQSDEARSVFQKEGGVSLKQFGDEFSQFVKPVGSNIKMWGNGADFDVSILSDIWQSSVKTPLPWHHWNTRCFRTFNTIHNCKDMVVRKGIHHNALDDAVYQTECVMAVFKKQGLK